MNRFRHFSLATPARATSISRRHFLYAFAASAGLGAVPLTAQAATEPPWVDVWKSPSCGCCQDWITHLEANGFRVRAHDVGNAAARARLKVPTALGSCHTAEVAGYAIEGHVPASDLRRLLKEKPRAIGLALPGMPIGSPGMDGPAYGGRRDPFDVLLIGLDGRTRVFNSHR